MMKLFEVARRLGQLGTTVLILGETGVGKEIVAQEIHRASPRASGPFVRLNCSAFPSTLLESELFGHDRGAFTGADRSKQGYFEAADGGTLFLDEVGELPLAAQVKLLNVLENREVHRLGATVGRPIDVHVVSATHRDLRSEIGLGCFRADFYYRLSAFTLAVPPLRERRVEISILAEKFLSDCARRERKRKPTLGPEAITRLVRYAWPGNVRELRNAIEHASVLAGSGLVLPEHLPAAIRG
jgi:two-component system response regulator AtoC